MDTPLVDALDPTDEVRAALRELENYLLDLKEQGVTMVEMDRGVLASLRPAAPAAAPRPVVPPPARPKSEPYVQPKPTAPPTVLREGDSLEAVAAEVATCTRCGLCRTRNRAVPGHGHPHPEIMFIGEGPGTEEDKQGLPFVGRAGELLTRMIVRMGLTRDDVFIGNVAKCRPTEDNAGKKDRPPTPEEMEACLPYLKRQIALLKPRVIVTLGATAAKGLFGDKIPPITKLRGNWMTFEGIDVMPTLHPSYLLRQGGENKGAFWDVWSDLEKALDKIGRKAPPKAQ